MKFSFGLLAGLAATVLAEDVLFVDVFKYKEYSEAIGTLGLTAKVVTEAVWRGMSTADFASYKAIVLADPSCSGDPTILKFLTDTKNTWGPAVQGNMILIGTDPSYHFGLSAGAKVLIDNAIKFSASGVSPTGSSLTGLYFALSCYYDAVDTATVDVLSYFGDFGVRGNLACYNNAHIVASSPALGTLDDAALSGWSCSVHEAFSRYPSVGVNGFQALAIAKDIVGDGSQTFGDGTIGLPYIISRGATPAGCGDGKWNAALGEECDDGNTKNGDGCSASCKCESGLPKGDGTCFPVPSNSTTSSRVSSSTMMPYKNATTTATVYETTTFCPAPYVTPTVPKERIIGVEIIVYIIVVEECKGDITSYVTSTGSTMHKPIWNTEMPGYPCYVCEMSKAGLPTPSSKFLTVSATTCPSPPPAYTPPAPVVVPCNTCLPYTFSTCPAYTTGASASVYVVPAPTSATFTHTHTVVLETTALATVKTSAAAFTSPTVKASGTAAPYATFTGAAGRKEAAGMAVVGGMVLAAML